MTGAARHSPFRNVLTLSAGDFAAKAAYFLAFVYMAQKLGVAPYGVLELAIALRAYLLLLADAGLEVWAVREAAKGIDPAALVARVVPARFVLAVFALGAAALFPAFPADPLLHRILPLLTLSALVQAFNLKWVFMGREQMTRVAVGLIASQLTFAALAVLLVRDASGLLLVPVAFLAGELVIAAYFWRLFVRAHGRPSLLPDWRGVRSIVRPVLTLGASQCLALMSYNVDSVLIGFLLGPGAVGLYAAAYKPVTAVLAAPISYFQGLFPALSRSYHEDRDRFRALLLRSLRFTTIFAVPVGVGGTLLAAPLVRLLFGPAYEESVPALQLLSWSAVLVTLRGNFRHTLNAVGHQRLDLACAAAAAAVNVALNLVLIPPYGIAGAAAATVISEIGWFLLVRYLFSRHVLRLPFLTAVWRPALAGAGMAAFLLSGDWAPWMLRGALSLVVYLAILVLAGEPELRFALARSAGNARAAEGRA